ncbi:hypothetical protein C8J57DRAFT_1525638 [Mycena rebaudengoi]|nr:hypothetical protein C8J57DRAFT_1525638 [Mycena rebaudengoi]
MLRPTTRVSLRTTHTHRFPSSFRFLAHSTPPELLPRSSRFYPVPLLHSSRFHSSLLCFYLRPPTPAPFFSFRHLTTPSTHPAVGGVPLISVACYHTGADPPCPSSPLRSHSPPSLLSNWQIPSALRLQVDITLTSSIYDTSNFPVATHRRKIPPISVAFLYLGIGGFFRSRTHASLALIIVQRQFWLELINLQTNARVHSDILFSVLSWVHSILPTSHTSAPVAQDLEESICFAACVRRMSPAIAIPITIRVPFRFPPDGAFQFPAQCQYRHTHGQMLPWESHLLSPPQDLPVSRRYRSLGNYLDLQDHHVPLQAYYGPARSCLYCESHFFEPPTRISPRFYRSFFYGHSSARCLNFTKTIHTRSFAFTD